MKVRVLLGIALCATVASYAQQNSALTLQEIVEKHNAELASQPRKATGKEATDAHFQRWLWYWKNHLDKDGYLVPETRKVENLARYENHRALSKGTAGSMADWKPLGADTLDQSWYGKGFGLGRINCMAFHPVTANTYYIGAANGGVWQTTDNGMTWKCLTDNLPVLSVSDIDVNPDNPNTIYICTGDRDAADNYRNFSIGVYKTTDGGATWVQAGATSQVKDEKLTNNLVINPADTNSLTLAKEDGIYKSYDGGANWNQVLTGPHVKQLVYHPADTTIIYAAGFDNSFDFAQVYRSTDGGATWTKTTSFDVATNDPAKRIELAVSNAAPNTVMAVVADLTTGNENGLLGIYKSTNSGASFTQVYTHNSCNGNLLSSDADATSCGGQGFYDLTIAVSPTNANHIYVGGVNGYFSTDGGTTWNNMNQWDQTLPGVSVVHADKHWMGFHPLVNTRLFECNDGGIAYTDNPSNANALWVDVTNGMEITQYYRIAVANAQDQLVVGGAQDNSVFVIEGTTVDFIGTGDGTNAKIDMIDTVVYGAEQNGRITRRDYRNMTEAVISATAQGPWVTSFMLNPHNHRHIIAGYDTIFYSQDQGDNWLPVTNGALVPNTMVSRVEMTPANAGTIYATVEGSDTVYYTHNFTPGNTATFTALGSPYGGVISDIEVDPKDKDHFWVTFGGYGGAQVAEYKNSAWTKINANLPDVPVLCIRMDTNNRMLYLGTDVGVFYKKDTASQWEAFDKGMPKVNVTDIEINYVTEKVYAATYGRGVWISPRQKDSVVSVAVVPYAEDVFTIAPNPNNGQFRIVTGKNVKAGSEVSISVYDLTGKMILQKQSILNTGGAVEVRAGNVPSGVYIVELANDTGVVGRKRVIIK